MLLYNAVKRKRNFTFDFSSAILHATKRFYRFRMAVLSG